MLVRIPENDDEDIFGEAANIEFSDPTPTAPVRLNAGK